MRGDSALWERESHKLPLAVPRQTAAGYADLFTWQPRMILLKELPSGEVEAAGFIAGRGFENQSNTSDPMHPYKTDHAHGKLPVRFKNDRGTWRDFDSLLPDDADLAPRTIKNAIHLVGNIAENLPESILVLGLRYEPPNANVDFWRMEQFTLPGALAGSRRVRTVIRQLLADAEECQNTLRAAGNAFARDLLNHGSTREPTKKDINGFVQQMSAIPWYWSTLESHFSDLLPEYTIDRDPEDIRRQWLISVRNTLAEAWQQHSDSFSMSDAWTIRSLLKAEKPVLRKLKELQNEINNLELKEKKA